MHFSTVIYVHIARYINKTVSLSLIAIPKLAKLFIDTIIGISDFYD